MRQNVISWVTYPTRWIACLQTKQSVSLKVVLCTLLTAVLITPLAADWSTMPIVHAASATHLKGAPSKPNKMDPRSGATSLTQRPTTPVPGTKKIGPPQSLTNHLPMPMKPGSIDLSPDQPAHFLGSDGRLELQIPIGAITVQDLTQAGGKISLHVTQIAQASGSNAGGSGTFSLGTYLMQLVDAQGHLLSHGLHQPVTTLYHLKAKERGLHLEHAYLVANSSVDDNTLKAQGVAFPSQIPVSQTLGPRQIIQTSLDRRTSTTLSAQLSTSSPSTSMSWDSDSPVATFGKPDPTSTDLSAGALTYKEALDLPAGPGGLTPPVNLTYSSESVNEQHNASAAASWVGEGWNLSLGAITWAEHNATQGCSSCGATWENVWSISDPYGTSSQLIPPNINVSTYNDDSSNFYCGTGNSAAYPCPILWHTATESHDKIYAYIGPVNIGDSFNAPCFRVWHPNGIMEEFGCTADSLQYYYVAGIGAEISAWNLDLITDPQGNQIHLTYQRDMENWTSPSTGKTYSYPRDEQLASISYDSPGCHNAQSMCTGSSWAPLMQVTFLASHGVANMTNGSPSGCNTGANMRCDDPVDLSGNSGLASSLIQNTFVLNNVQVQVRTSSTGSWNALRTYQLSYEQSGPSTITDPASGISRSVAGFLDLTQIQQFAGGGAMLLYSGEDTSSTSSYAYMKVFDVSSQNLVVGPNTTLSYWVFPQSTATSNLVSGSNSTCVAVDMIFSDGSDLRDSGAVDQNGVKLHPASQCGHLKLDQWNLVTSNIGAVKNGKTISRINFGYDQPANTGGYRGFFDDISLTNPNSPTPLFFSGFEPTDPQPTWTNTVDTSGGGINNIGGICCNLTGPEAFVGTQYGHADSGTLPSVIFTYSTLTNTYVDSTMKPTPTTNCGPSWNTGNGSGCLLWAQSYAGNSRFLATISNGQGLSQSFSWAVAHNNTHGVPGGGAANANPLACDTNQSGYPCNEADDRGWSHVVLTQENATTTRLTQNGQGGTQTITPITETANYSYQLTYPLPRQMCPDCVAGMYWGNQNDGDYLSYYNGVFTGFAQATVDEPDGSIDVHHFYAGEGWGVYDMAQVTCFATYACHAAPWWDLANAAHGAEYQSQVYKSDGTTLLKQVDTTYQAICPPTGVSGTPASSQYGTWDGKLVSALDHNNPVVVCDVHLTQQKEQTFDGASSSVSSTTSYSYDTYGRVTQATTTGNSGTPTQAVQNTSYVWNDAVSATQTSASGTYILDTAAFSDVEDGSGNRLQCSYTSYDGQSYTTGQTSALTLGEQTTQDNYANCGTSSNSYTPSGKSTTTTVYDAFGNVLATNDPDANATISGHTGCTVNSVPHTKCTTYDSTFEVFATQSGNALNQTSSTNYANTGNAFGFGTWPQSTTDVNGQITRTTYDLLGRTTSLTLPGETSGLNTSQWLYADWCSGTASQAPCVELDEIDRLNGSTTTIRRAFYDGEGRLVETRAPGPGSQDVVTYAYYDSAGRQIFKSNPYFVTAYTGPSGAAAYSIPDSTQPGTSTAYPTLLSKSVTDPNSHTTTSTASVICSPASTSDTGCYVQLMGTDANGHEIASLTGAFGKGNYKQVYTGTSPYTLYATTTYTYDAAGELLSTKSPDGSVTSATYDGLGRIVSQNDPDHGTTTVSYDPNGNPTQTVDARGTAGTVDIGYDGLNRVLWRNSTNSSTGAWASYTYDSTANGNQGVGRLTSESFTGSGSQSGSYAYTYDARGQQTAQTVTINGTNYTIQASYNDAGQVISQTYPTGEVVSPGYTPTGWLNGLSTSQNSITTQLVSNLTYMGLSGAAGQITTMSEDNGTYSYAASFDTGMRLTGASLTLASNSSLLYQTQPTYDAVSNVVGVQTSISGQTDTQQFCYDDLDRLTWAGTNGTPPCASQAITAGTLTAAQYQQNYSYNVESGLTTGPAGSYTYGNSSHPHAVTTTTNGASFAYDAAGNMTCRAPTSTNTCSGTQNGQQLSYDSEGRLSNWQNLAGSATSTVNYLYDGEGNRVAMQATVNGTTTTTAYIGSIEEVQTTGSTTTATTFYTVGGKRIAANVNGTFYYFGYDALGSQVLVLNANGAVVGSQLYGPYGNQRYTNGTLPTSIGFTGQRADSVTGLDYYVARYYDPTVGQFLSPDGKQGNAPLQWHL